MPRTARIGTSKRNKSAFSAARTAERLANALPKQECTGARGRPVQLAGEAVVDICEHALRCRLVAVLIRPNNHFFRRGFRVISDMACASLEHHVQIASPTRGRLALLRQCAWAIRDSFENFHITGLTLTSGTLRDRSAISRRELLTSRAAVCVPPVGSLNTRGPALTSTNVNAPCACNFHLFNGLKQTKHFRDTKLRKD